MSTKNAIDDNTLTPNAIAYFLYYMYVVSEKM